MAIRKFNLISSASILLVIFFISSCGGTEKRTQAVIDLPPAAPIGGGDAGENMLRFLEGKIKEDPEDFSANNKLAAIYLQKLRETGNIEFLDLAFRSARASLDSVADIRNSGGLAALAQAEFAAHEFSKARDHAARLAELEPGKSYPQGILGDAMLELGEYDKAEIAYKKIVALDSGISPGSETRFARLAQLRGDNAGAQKHLATALTLALNASSPPRETVAWIRWQLGEIAFSVGDYETAEKHYRDSLTTFPDYHRALASLGRVSAAQNDLAGAIEQYEKLVRLLPEMQFVAALGDLYAVSGRADDAQRQYDLVEQIGRLNGLNGSLYNRQLSVYYADHDIKAEEAYRMASQEYEVRRDIYGADTLAWTALKTGRLDEAKERIKEALRLGTQDAKLFFHAGMIAHASGDKDAANGYLQQALELNPQFDPIQTKIAKTRLENN